MTGALIGLVLLLLISALAWRYLVRRRSLPCPHWLVPLLENPYMNRVAGAALVLNRARVGRDMVLLDVGCGPGRLTVPAAERVGASGRVVALDIQRSMLDRLGERVAEAGCTNVMRVLAGAGAGALSDNSFDRALLVTVLGEIPDRTAALQEIRRALKPGGVVSITEVIPDPHYQRRSTVRELAIESGFRVDEVFSGLLSYTMNLRKAPVA
jgi:ubiquinone/menaquinone biosynthesis C-methylase UbiE